MAAAAAMRKHFYLGKKSEYRQNFLPFDYYDFWITAKENENLRCRNKLRDYLHTPFDWDEDQELYLEQRPATTGPQHDQANHATQTSGRPNRRDQLKKTNKDFEQYSTLQQQIQQQQHNLNQQKQAQALQQQQQQFQQKQNQPRSVPPVEATAASRPQTPTAPQQPQSVKPRPTSISRRQRRAKKPRAVRLPSHYASSANSNQVSEPRIEVQGVYANLNDGRGVVSKPRRVRATSAQEEYRFRPSDVDRSEQTKQAQQQQQHYEVYEDERKQPQLHRSHSNIAIQTPLGWNLRDFKNSGSRPSSAKKPARPISAVILQPRKAPFANYGWATKTKDLSIKPTHNAIANKHLAKEHNENAILELTLHKLKKDATRVANEYSTIESHLAEHFLTGRSETRAWNSEYDDRYPDYSKTALKKDLYLHDKPYNLAKSSLVLNYPPLKRGPRSATKKIYFE